MQRHTELLAVLSSESVLTGESILTDKPVLADESILTDESILASKSILSSESVLTHKAILADKPSFQVHGCHVERGFAESVIVDVPALRNRDSILSE